MKNLVRILKRYPEFNSVKQIKIELKNIEFPGKLIDKTKFKMSSVQY